MELLEGRSLAEKLAGKPQPAQAGRRIDRHPGQRRAFAAKSGFIHRDLKPSNILFTVGGFPKIADFGLVRPIQSGPEYTFSGPPRIGTPSYMATAQQDGACHRPCRGYLCLGSGALRDAHRASPVLRRSLPAELKRPVVGKEPPPPSRLNAKVPRDLETICLKCLEKNPARASATREDLADDLHRFLDGRPVLARPVGLVERGTVSRHGGVRRAGRAGSRGMCWHCWERLSAPVRGCNAKEARGRQLPAASSPTKSPGCTNSHRETGGTPQDPHRRAEQPRFFRFR